MGISKNKYWLIEGLESGKVFYSKRVRIGYFSEERIKELLMALAGKAGLEYEEIIGAYAKKNTKISNDLLYVSQCDNKHFYSCGENPYFIAKLISEMD